MSQISIWPLRKTWLSTLWQNPCWQSQRSDVSCSWPPGFLTHSSLQILSKSLRFRGWRSTRTFSSLHRFSMGFRSGDWLGHSRTLMCFFLSHSFVALAVCFGSFSCWNQCPGWLQWVFLDFFCCYSVSHCSNKPTIKIIDWSFLCQWANVQNQQGIKYFFPPLYLTDASFWMIFVVYDHFMSFFWLEQIYCYS